MKIVKLPSGILREKSQKVSFPLSKEKIELIEYMIKYIDQSQEPGSEERAGVGISAVQLGHLDRMFYVNAPASDGEQPWREFLINPTIVKTSNESSALETGEGCLSVDDHIPGQQGLVHRSFKVTVEGYSYFSQKNVRVTKQGYQAIIIQHEQDHLNGKLFIDRIDKFNPWLVLDDEILI